MGFPTVLVDALHAPLEDGPYVFNGVRVDVSANVFILGVYDGVMGGKLFASLGIDTAFVGVQD